MLESNEEKIRFVIDDEAITFCSFTEYIWLIDDFLNDLQKTLGRKTKTRDEREFLEKGKARIVSIGDGCIWIDVVVPIVCACIPVFYDIVKILIESYKSKCITYNQSDGVIKLSKLFDKRKKRWDYGDEALFVKKTVNTYVKRKKSTDIGVFVTHLPHTLKKYGISSLTCKLKNAKAVFAKLGISNSLGIDKLKNYSKRHLELTAMELKIPHP